MDGLTLPWRRLNRPFAEDFSTAPTILSGFVTGGGFLNGPNLIQIKHEEIINENIFKK